MVDRISLNRFKNINFAPNKNVVKITAATTLLLSTAACKSEDLFALYMITGGPLWGPVLGFLAIMVIIESLSGGGRGGDPPTSSY